MVRHGWHRGRENGRASSRRGSEARGIGDVDGSMREFFASDVYHEESDVSAYPTFSTLSMRLSGSAYSNPDGPFSCVPE